LAVTGSNGILITPKGYRFSETTDGKTSDLVLKQIATKSQAHQRVIWTNQDPDETRQAFINNAHNALESNFQQVYE